MVPPAMLTGRASPPDRQDLDQRVLKRAAEARGQQLTGGVVIDVKGAGLGCEGTLRAGVKGKVESCWTGIVLLAGHSKVQKLFFFSDSTQPYIKLS